MTSEKQWGQMRRYAYLYALRLNGGYVQMAEDIAQEAMLSLLKRDINLATWRALIKRVVHRRWVDYWRKPYNSRERTVQLGDIERVASYKLLTRPPRQPYGDKMKAALETLTPEIRECLWSVIVDGYTHQETADRLEIPLGTVLSRVYRGKAHLRQELEKVHAHAH